MVVGVDNDTHDFLNAVPIAQYVARALVRGLEFGSRCGHLSQNEECNACCEHRTNLSYALLPVNVAASQRKSETTVV